MSFYTKQYKTQASEFLYRTEVQAVSPEQFRIRGQDDEKESVKSSEKKSQRTSGKTRQHLGNQVKKVAQRKRMVNCGKCC